MHYLIQSGPACRDERNLFAATDHQRTVITYDELVPVADPSATVPVGSVEFVRRYADLNRIRLPDSDTYPESLRWALRRPVQRCTFSAVPPGFFCKPLRTKAFTGGIAAGISETVDPSEPVWCSPPIQLLAEFRTYIISGRVVGSSRYDDGDNEAELEMDFVHRMIAAYSDAPVGYALDVGITDAGSLLVEANDGWALGYYRWGNMNGSDYIKLLTERWMEIVDHGVR
jgi:hypothetical protein